MIAAEHRRRLAGYRMPAEWEPHHAAYLVWPHNVDTWPGKFEPIPMAFAQIAAAIGTCEPVRILLRDRAEAAIVKELVAEAVASLIGEGETEHAIAYAQVPTNDSWVRDHGPIFVNRIAGAADSWPAQIALDWRFNSWGEKYGAFDLDDVVPKRLGELYGFEVIEPGIVLEGGSIDVNGAGSLLTTESCLLNRNRNPSLSRGEIEEYLKVYLSVNNILWLGDGIAGDDTDGHIDDLARFVTHDTIVTVVEDDPADVNYKVLRDNLERLQAMRDHEGRAFRIETLPMPPGQYFDGTRLPASYANFYIANGGVIVPVFGCKADAGAIAVLTRLFPGRSIIGVPSGDLVWGLGAIHCLTQQHPAP